ncbi:MAG: hypothetical protein M9918_21390 [Anaerolineae bacterium]|nr:hypothetical protein [Anaerolineae bacterium]MCO5195558.1 hypothetical protein [Anaerolineae bacterium]
MSGKRSNSKGKRGELEAAKILADILNTTARRGRQYAGSAESPDVLVNGFDVQLEVKRCEKLSIYPALAQAERDAAGKRPSAVLHRRNHKPWLFVCRVDDLPEIARMVAELVDG